MHVRVELLKVLLDFWEKAVNWTLLFAQPLLFLFVDVATRIAGSSSFLYFSFGPCQQPLQTMAAKHIDMPMKYFNSLWAFPKVTHQHLEFAKAIGAHILEVDGLLSQRFCWVVIQAINEPLQVRQRLEDSHNSLSVKVDSLKILHSVKSLLDVLLHEQRLHQPLAEESPAEFSRGAIDFVEQRMFRAKWSVKELQVLQRLRV